MEAVAARNGDRLPDRRDAGGRRRNRHLPVLFGGKAVDAEAGRIRPRGHRGRCRAGSRQQRFRGRHAGAAVDARLAHHGDGGDHAGRLPAVRPATRPAAVHQQFPARLGPDRQPAGGELHASGAEPAADRPVGETAHHPQALALCRYPGVRHAGHHRRQSVRVRTRHSSRLRPARLRPAPFRLSDRAGGDRPHPRADGRTAATPGAGHQKDLGKPSTCSAT